jgi:hypothetical protein
MAQIALAIIVVLWLFGFVHIPYLNSALFTIMGHPITLYNILILLIILWVIEILPSPLRQIIMLLLLLWVLSVMGIITIAGFSQLVVVAIIVGVIASLFR